MIDKKFLEGLGVADEETVNKIIAEYGADIKTEKDKTAEIQKSLDEANKTIQSFKDMDIDGIKKSADEWKSKAEQAEKEREAFEHRTKLTQYVKGLKLKDDIYEAHVTKLLEDKGIKFEGDKLIGGDDVVQTFRKDHEDAFIPDSGERVSGATSGNVPKTMNAVEQAFYAKNPQLAPKI